MAKTRAARRGTVDPRELEKFSALAEEWWRTDGPFRQLHKLNPVRVAYARDRLAAHFRRDPLGRTPLRGLTILDVGCGGGLVAEPMARLGARVVGIDAAEANIAVARAHARDGKLAITYRRSSVESLARTGTRYDAILALEVIEHVGDLDVFLGACARLTAPGGALVLATLNRTLKSLALAVVLAEHVLGWVPRGTHDWRKFVRPDELGERLARHGVELREVSGVTYNPLTDSWGLAADAGVNYMAFAARVPRR